MSRLRVSSSRNFCSSDNQDRVNFHDRPILEIFILLDGLVNARGLSEGRRVRADFLIRNTPQRPDQLSFNLHARDELRWSLMNYREKLAFILLYCSA